MNILRVVFSALIALFAFTLPSLTRAEEKVMTNTDNAHPFGFTTEAGALTGTVNCSTITKTDLRVGAFYDFSRRLRTRIDIGAGTLRLRYKGSMDDSLWVDTTMWSYLGVSGSIGASYRLYETERLQLDGFGEFETSIFHTEPAITSMRATTPQGAFDVTPYGKKNVGGSLFWNRFAVGVQSRFVFGRFEPNVGVAFHRVDSVAEVHLNDDSRKTLSRLGYNVSHVETRHPLTFWYVPVTTGVDFRPNDRTAIGVAGTVAPALDSWIYGGTLHFERRF